MLSWNYSRATLQTLKLTQSLTRLTRLFLEAVEWMELYTAKEDPKSLKNANVYAPQNGPMVYQPVAQLLLLAETSKPNMLSTQLVLFGAEDFMKKLNF